MALIEALMASAVLGIGLLGATQLTLKAFQTALNTRQQALAQTLAQEAMDSSTINRAECALPKVVNADGVRYTRQVLIQPRGNAGLFDVKVTVSWPSAMLARTSTPASELTLEWHSSYAQVPTWLGVSLP
jgi:Tfp pilus assembly protein PilV